MGWQGCRGAAADAIEIRNVFIRSKKKVQSTDGGDAECSAFLLASSDARSRKRVAICLCGGARLPCPVRHWPVCRWRPGEGPPRHVYPAAGDGSLWYMYCVVRDSVVPVHSPYELDRSPRGPWRRREGERGVAFALLACLSGCNVQHTVAAARRAKHGKKNKIKRGQF